MGGDLIFEWGTGQLENYSTEIEIDIDTLVQKDIYCNKNMILGSKFICFILPRPNSASWVVLGQFLEMQFFLWTSM